MSHTVQSIQHYLWFFLIAGQQNIISTPNRIDIRQIPNNPVLLSNTWQKQAFVCALKHSLLTVMLITDSEGITLSGRPAGRSLTLLRVTRLSLYLLRCILYLGPASWILMKLARCSRSEVKVTPRPISIIIAEEVHTFRLCGVAAHLFWQFTG